ncbi:MAG TPA: A24 family peptidase [Caulobacteraceae bacterium]|nr:A24 family peptidase [Caulobacteraceae bacterium]
MTGAVTPAWLIWVSDAALVFAAALVLAVGPQGLLTEISGERPTWRRAALIALPAAGAGLACLAGCAALSKTLAAGPLAAAAVVLTAVLIVDARWLVIPDVYALGLGLVALPGLAQLGWASALAGAVVGAGLLAAVRWAFLRWRGVEGLGFGDVKLMAAVGLLVGLRGALWVIVAAATLGLVWILARRPADPRRPLAPFAACAALPAFAVLAIERLSP